MSSGVVCDILISEGAVAAVGEEWRQLQARAGRISFTDYDWFDIWWRTLGKSLQSQTLHVVTGRIAGKLVAVLPLAVARRRGLRIMQAAGHKAFYCCDMLCENEEQAIALWKAAYRSPHYDFAHIRDVYSESASYKPLVSFANKRDVIEAYALNVQWPSSEEWLKVMPGRTRRDHFHYRRRLEQKGAVKLEVCRSEPVPTEIIDRMVDRKIAWSKENQKPGLFDHPNVREYFQQLTKKAAQQGRLMLCWLKCGNEDISYFLSFVNGKELRGYVIASESEWKYYSPGNLVMAEWVFWGIDNGMTRVDIAQGGSYKVKFSNEWRECAEFTFAGSLNGKLLELAFITARRTMRKVRGDSGKVDRELGVHARLLRGANGKRTV